MAHIRRVTHRSGKTSWQVRYRARDGRERAKNFARKVDAERHLIKVEGAKLEGTWTDPQSGRIRFGEWATRWMRTRRDRRPTTIARDESMMASAVLPHLGEMPLAAIKQETLQEWVTQLTIDGYAPASIRKAWQLASGALRAAVVSRRIAIAPTEGVLLPKLEQEEQRFLSAGEILRLADEIEPRYRCMVLLGGFAGLRFGEVCALRPQSFSELIRSVTVTETLTEVKGDILIGPPKTRASRRSVTLPRFVVDELIDHMTEFPPGEDGLLFTAPEGGPISPTHWRRRVWKPAVRSSVGGHFGFTGFGIAMSLS